MVEVAAIMIMMMSVMAHDDDGDGDDGVHSVACSVFVCVFVVEPTGDCGWSTLLYGSRYMLACRPMNADSVVASALRLCPRGFLHRLAMG